jgi:hypothetical protein
MANVSETIPQLMSFDVDQMLRSKQALRRRLTALPIAEKLRLLDGLRERALVIRSANHRQRSAAQEQPPDYGKKS